MILPALGIGYLLAAPAAADPAAVASGRRRAGDARRFAVLDRALHLHPGRRPALCGRVDEQQRGRHGFRLQRRRAVRDLVPAPSRRCLAAEAPVAATSVRPGGRQRGRVQASGSPGSPPRRRPGAGGRPGAPAGRRSDRRRRWLRSHPGRAAASPQSWAKAGPSCSAAGSARRSAGCTRSRCWRCRRAGLARAGPGAPTRCARGLVMWGGVAGHVRRHLQRDERTSRTPPTWPRWPRRWRPCPAPGS